MSARSRPLKIAPPRADVNGTQASTSIDQRVATSSEPLGAGVGPFNISQPHPPLLDGAMSQMTKNNARTDRPKRSTTGVLYEKHTVTSNEAHHLILPAGQSALLQEEDAMFVKETCSLAAPQSTRCPSPIPKVQSATSQKIEEEKTTHGRSIDSLNEAPLRTSQRSSKSTGRKTKCLEEEGNLQEPSADPRVLAVLSIGEEPSHPAKPLDTTQRSVQPHFPEGNFNTLIVYQDCPAVPSLPKQLLETAEEQISAKKPTVIQPKAEPRSPVDFPLAPPIAQLLPHTTTSTE